MPAFQNIDQAKGYDAAAALTKKRAVKFDGNNVFAVTPITAATDIAAGVAMFSVSAAEILKGKGASVVTDGIALMEASGTINEGDRVSFGTDGRAKAAAGGERVQGVARSYVSGAGNEVAVQLDIPGVVI